MYCVRFGCDGVRGSFVCFMVYCRLCVFVWCGSLEIHLVGFCGSLLTRINSKHQRTLCKYPPFLCGLLIL